MYLSIENAAARYFIKDWYVLFLVMSSHVGQISSTASDINVNNFSHDCLEAYKSLSHEVLLKYIDASGKPPSGIFELNNNWFGSFSECKKIMKSRYCLVSVTAVLDLGQNTTKVLYPLHWGVCLPYVCTKKDMTGNIDDLLKKVSKIANMSFPGKMANLNIECDVRPKYSAAVVLTIILCGIFVGLCLIATIIEEAKNIRRQKPSIRSTEEKCDETSSLLVDMKSSEPDKKSNTNVTWLNMLHCFSLIRNTNVILNTDVGKNDLTYLHGIRVLSLFWVILFHWGMVITAGRIPMDNPVDAARQFGQRLSAMVILYGSFAVDAFLVLSGLLVMYVNLIKHEKSGKIKWLKFYIHRLWRLTPLYMFAILFMTNIRPFLGDGPWLYKLRDTSACSDYWWTNLLYINNFYPTFIDETCLIQTWYLSVDMQFYLLSPIFIIVFLRFGFRPLVSIGSVVVFASILTTGILVGVKGIYPVVPFPTSENLESFREYQKIVYIKPYSRIPPYIVGMILGCLVYRNINKKIRINWYSFLLLWTVSISVALTIIYAPHSAIKDDPHSWSVGEKAIFASLQYFLWSLCVAWVIFACQYGYAGLIKNILGGKFWIPLSRINYAAFIVHLDIMLIVAWNNESPLHMTTFTFINLYLTILVLSYGSAFIFAVFVEIPLANLGAMFLVDKKQR